MKLKIIKVFLVIVFFFGFGVMAYPSVSNQWNTYVQSTLINEYDTTVESLTEESYTKEWEDAKAFDETIEKNDIYADVFGQEEDIELFKASDYYKTLNVNGDGVMGYLSIPKINIKYSIYHGTFESDLQTGLGHLNGTSLPIGGESTHSVIAGHRGLPTSALLTDIDQLQIGDKFYIHVLGETLSYQVDQILPMVEADDMDTLEAALAIEEGKDYVTLFTCTPYGVNTHRLLVRGSRVEYLGEDAVPTGVDAVVETAKDYYMIIFCIALIVVAILITIIGIISKKKASKSKENKDEVLGSI